MNFSTPLGIASAIVDIVGSIAWLLMAAIAVIDSYKEWKFYKRNGAIISLWLVFCRLHYSPGAPKARKRTGWLLVLWPLVLIFFLII